MNAKDLRNGMVINYSGKILQVISFATVNDCIEAEVVNLKTDLRETISFHQSDDFFRVMIGNRELEYSYQDGGVYNFMDFQTFELISVTKEMLAQGFHFVKASDVCRGVYVENELIRIYPPSKVRFEIVNISDGNNRSTKTATLENGLTIQVPDYYRQGDIAVINPASGFVLTRE